MIPRAFRSILAVLAVGVLTAVPVLAQPGGETRQRPLDLAPDRFGFDRDLPYADDVPSPSDVLGYELGTEFTLYADVVDYVETVAETSDRVTIQRYGKTHEGRELVYLVVTSPDNQQRIDGIREANLRLAEPQQLSGSERQELLADQPVMVSYSYNIHGNEPAGTGAAMQVLYRMAAATDSETQRLLDESVLLLWPTVNPDGRDRYVYWYKSMKRDVVAAEPDDIAHDEPFPQGRTNHYWFDLNRDWVWGVHPEMRGLAEAYQQWLPQVHTDYHEQGYDENYFTMPGTTPRNPLLPESYVALADTFGRANIAAFDRNQISYATREAFDFFYPSYGSSYPSVMGGIGMLTEQGGINAGRAVETDDGYVLTFRQRIYDHYTTSLATLKAAVRNRQQLLDYFADARNPAETKTVETEAYLFPDDGGEGYLYDVVEMLRRHGVEVERTTESFETSAMDYRDGERERQRFASGTMVVRADQPEHLFINSILQRTVAFQDSVMYDMSTWSAPLAYNLEAYSTEQDVDVATETLQDDPVPPAGVVNPDARYAYVIDWNQRHAPRALAKLWDLGYRVRSARKPFDTGTRAFSRGTLIVLRGRNPDKQDPAADMERVARETGVRIHGLDTGRMEEGIDLASRNSRVVDEPKTALLVDQPFSTYTSGQIWYLFDQETRLPVTRIRSSSLEGTGTGEGRYVRYGKADINDYDVLILPGAGRLEAVFDSTQQAALKDWVRRGGTLVATEESATFFTEETSGFTDVEAVEDTTEATGPYTPFIARGDSAGLDYIPGAALDGRLDATHPLAFGIGDRVYPLKYGTEALAPSADLQTAGYYADEAPSDLLVSGYASQENLRRLAGNAFAATLPMGEGEVVFLVDNTQYRMFWIGPARMMQNAVMLVPGML